MTYHSKTNDIKWLNKTFKKDSYVHISWCCGDGYCRCIAKVDEFLLREDWDSPYAQLKAKYAINCADEVKVGNDAFLGVEDNEIRAATQSEIDYLEKMMYHSNHLSFKLYMLDNLSRNDLIKVIQYCSNLLKD